MEEIQPVEVLRRLSNVLASLLAIADVDTTERVTEKWRHLKCQEIAKARDDWSTIAQHDNWCETLFEAANRGEQLAELFYRERANLGASIDKWRSSTFRASLEAVKFCHSELEYMESGSNLFEAEIARVDSYQEAEMAGCDFEYQSARDLVAEPAIPLTRNMPNISLATLDEEMNRPEPPALSEGKRNSIAAPDCESPRQIAPVCAPKGKPGRRVDEAKQEHAAHANDLRSAVPPAKWKECSSAVNTKFGLIGDDKYNHESIRNLHRLKFGDKSGTKAG